MVEGETTTFTVRLAESPTGSETLHVISTDELTATVSPAVLTLDSDNPVAKVTVSSSEDDDDVINETLELVLSIDGAATHRVMTRVLDNDVQQLVTDATNLRVGESEDGTFSVRLARKPSEPVAVAVWSGAPETVAVSPATLTFAPTSYDVPAVITVTALADANVVDGAASVYAGNIPNVNDERVHVSVRDDDVQALVLDTTAVGVPEGGTSTFTVSLAFDPLEQTYVYLSPCAPSTATVMGSYFISFDSSDYNVPKTVTLTSKEDSDAADSFCEFELSGPAFGIVTAHVIDNDALLFYGTTLALYEGDTTTAYISLANDPGPAGLTVTAEVIGGDATVVPNTVSFSSDNYSLKQPLSITGTIDATSNAHNTVRIRVSAPGQTSREIEETFWDRIPGRLSASYWPQRSGAGQLGSVDVSFDPYNGWPGDGRLVITYPPGYDASSASFESSSADGSYSVTATTSTITVIRSNGSTRFDSVRLRLQGVRNPPVSGTYAITVATRTSTDEPLDNGAATHWIVAAYMPDARVTLADLQPGATTTSTFVFTTQNPWPGEGKLKIYFPADFGVSAATVAAQSGVDGTFSPSSVAGTAVTLTRTGGTTVPGGTPISLTLANINNPATSQATDLFQVVTQTASGDWIDTGYPKGVVIGCPASITKMRAQQGSNVPFGGEPWRYPEAVTTANWGSYSDISLLEASDYLVASDFQFVLPVGAIITGIRFDVAKDAWAPLVDSAVRVVKTTIGQTDRASATPWTIGRSVETYGGTTDLWGETWSAADIESSTFGVALAVKAPTPGSEWYVRVGNIRATVYLTCP